MTAATSEHGNGHVGHVPSIGLLVAVLVALLFLTIVTVGVAQIDLGFLNIWLALGIAAVKASLVCVFFMHLKWDRPFNSVLLLGSLLLFALFLSFCMMDTRERICKSFPSVEVVSRHHMRQTRRNRFSRIAREPQSDARCPIGCCRRAD